MTALARRQLPLVLVLLLIALAAGGAAYAAVAGVRGANDPGATERRTGQALPTPSYPAPPAAPGQQVARRLSAVPPPNSVRVVPGAFTDRVRFDRLRLVQARGASAVTGTMTVTSDVSEIIVAEVVVGFYDGRGSLLGTQTVAIEEFEHDHGGGHAVEPPVTKIEGEPQRLSVRGPRGAVSATVSLPTLVNE
jgi:hypothetical protein